MLPLVSTTWFGSVTKLPGRAPGSLGMKSPRGSASKIVTLTTSPIPSVIRGGGRENTFDALHWVLGAAFAAAWYLGPQPLGSAAAAGARKRIASTPATARRCARVKSLVVAPGG